jgi:hypothetical protein
MVRHDQGAFIRVPVGVRDGRRRREGRLIRKRSMTCVHYRRQSDRESLRADESAADLERDAANKEATNLVDCSTSAAVCRNSKYGLELSYLIYQIRNIKLEPHRVGLVVATRSSEEETTCEFVPTQWARSVAIARCSSRKRRRTPRPDHKFEKDIPNDRRDS